MLKAQKLFGLNNTDLIKSLAELSSKENQTTIEILFHLAEAERRKLHLELGYSSLFNYCTKSELKYSEPAAHRRISSARLVARYPNLAQLLLSKELSLSTLSLVAGVIKDDNIEEVTCAISGKSRREVEGYLASFRPKKVLREVVKPLAVLEPVSTKMTKKTPPHVREQQPPFSSEEPEFTFTGERRDNQQKIQEPISEKRYQLSFSVSEEVYGKLEKAKKLLSGKYPKGAKLEEVLDDALEALLDKRCPDRRIARRVKRQQKITPVKSAAVKQSRPLGEPTRPIPQAIRDQVFQRDKSCCYLSPDGRRCGSKHDLEVHHLRPFAKGGDHSLENLSLRCREHNCYQAKHDFGQDFMAKYVREAEVDYGRVNLFLPEKATAPAAYFS